MKMKILNRTILVFLISCCLLLINCKNNETLTKDDLFFVKADTVFHYSFIPMKATSKPFSSFNFRPYGWEVYIKNHIKIRSESYTYTNCADIIWDNYDSDKETEAHPIIYVNGERMKINLVTPADVDSGPHKISNKYDVSGLEFGAFYFDYFNKTLTLKNNFEGNVDFSFMPIHNMTNEDGVFFKNGVIVQAIEMVETKIGENISNSRWVNIDTLSIINLSNLEFLCFGLDGINALATKKNMELYSTEIPFLYVLKKIDGKSKD
jgi:hypothetical protein